MIHDHFRFKPKAHIEIKPAKYNIKNGAQSLGGWLRKHMYIMPGYLEPRKA